VTLQPALPRWIGFAAMSLGMFMAILDIQVVATSLPTIQAALDIPPDRMSWVQTAYLIAEIIAIPLTGPLIRMATMRWLFVGAVGLFTLGSIGCAVSGSFAALASWRVLQGFAGGTLIPAVFAAVVLIMPPSSQALATTLAGLLAVLAPTLGPTVGGWITDTYDWPWLFLINVGPGLVAALAGAFALPRGVPNPALLFRIDALALLMLAAALAALELALKEAPQRGWLSPTVLALAAVAIIAGGAFVRRSLARAAPLVDLSTFGDRDFALACLLSFVLGIGLYGSTYLLPVFLAFVRGHDALEIGEIMIVTGLAQLVSAPIAVMLERRLDARPLIGFGFLTFGVGLGLSAWQTIDSDFRDMALPQVLRGAAVMFCLLPPTRIALGRLAPERVGDASGLFNLMRNLGGAIGIALIDSIVYGRAPALGDAIGRRLQAGDAGAAALVGIPLDMFEAQRGHALDADTLATVKGLVEKAALTQAIDEAFLVVAGITVAALLVLPFLRLAPPVDAIPPGSEPGPAVPPSSGGGSSASAA
jgi:MFS transporter, DHA2 family, multidrug resistance protein